MNRKFLMLLSMGHLITDLSGGGLVTLLPILRESYGLTYSMAGLIVLVSNLSSSVIQPVFGYISDIASRRWFLLIGPTVSALGIGLVGISGSYPLILLLVMLNGLGVAAYHPEASKVAHEESGNAKGSGMALFSVGGNIGFGLGPAVMSGIVAFAGVRGTLLLVILGIAMSLVLWGVLRSKGGENLDPANPPHTEATASGRFPSEKPVLTALFLLLFVTVFRSWAYGGIFTYLSMYYVDFLGGDPGVAGVLVTLFLISGAVGTLVGGPIADRCGRKPVIAASTIGGGLFFALFLLTSGLLSLVFLMVAGFVLISSFAITVVYGQELMPGSVGTASGLMLGFSIGIGGLGIPVLGYVGDVAGISMAMWLIALLPTVGGLAAFAIPEGSTAHEVE